MPGWRYAIVSGLAIFPAVFGFTMLGDWKRDTLDSRTTR
jgi:ABC-type dipeptide/oligopeptide/nickel transport system permease subunit